MITSIANELIQKKYQVKFATSTAILNEIKKTWNNQAESESNLLDELSKVEVLCIDDFGIEKCVTWMNEKYYHIINERYINKKVTLYTSNYPLESLEYDERIKSRIMERNLQVAFPAESIRVQKSIKLKEAMINSMTKKDNK